MGFLNSDKYDAKIKPKNDGTSHEKDGYTAAGNRRKRSYYQM
jgi:hypothetical protein